MMNKGQGDLQTISCSVSLSSCRLRAESLARAFNSKIWSRTFASGVKSHGDSNQPLINSAIDVAGISNSRNVIDQPPRAHEIYGTIGNAVIGHYWVNGMQTDEEEEEEAFDTPPFSTPPSPSEENIVVHPPINDSLSPFKFPGTNDINAESPDQNILYEKLEKVAARRACAEEGPEAFYDASDEQKSELPEASTSEFFPSRETAESTSTDSKNEEPNASISDQNCPGSLDASLTEAEERPKLLRSISLRSGPHPPDTPPGKKMVRFADALGLDLEAVRHIVSGELPRVPSSAYEDLDWNPDTVGSCPPVSPTVSVRLGGLTSGLQGLVPEFRPPELQPDFEERVRRQGVCLKNVFVTDLSVRCVMSVLNLSFEKCVAVRYSTDEWRTYRDVPAQYVPTVGSQSEFDQFACSLFPSARKSLCFAIRYTVSGVDRWDNNNGRDYHLRFYGEDPGLHHFY